MLLKKGLDKREKAEALTAELDALKVCRADFESAWEEAQRFVSSTVLTFSDVSNEAHKKYHIPSRITSRPAHFLETLVSGISGYSINPNILWLKLGLVDNRLENRYGVKDWLEESEDVLYREFNRSNLYAQIPGLIESAATFGHGVMLIDEDVVAEKIRCAVMNPAEIYLDTNEYDEVDTVFREFFMTLENAAAYFGLDKLAQEVRDNWNDEESKRKTIRILHAVYKNKSPDGDYLVSNNFKYASIFVDIEHKHIIQDGGYINFPYAVFIWKKTIGKTYGVSPAICASKDIRLLHVTEEARLEVAQKSAKPFYNVPIRMKGTEQLVPDGRNYFRMDDGQISPIAIGANFPITIEVTRDFENRIKDWFHVDFFLMLQQQSRQMTATEVVELQGEKAAVLSNMVSSLNQALTKIVQRSVDILFRQGKMPELPFALQENRTAMKVDFMGILAQAQKKAHQTGGIMQGIQIMGALAQLAPAVPQVAEAFDYVDSSEILKRAFEAGGMSQLCIREEDDVKKTRQARAEMQAAMAQQQQAMAAQELLAKNFNQLNEPVNPKGALAQMTGGAL